MAGTKGKLQRHLQGSRGLEILDELPIGAVPISWDEAEAMIRQMQADKVEALKAERQKWWAE